MAFGDTQNQRKQSSASKNVSFDPVFLKLPEGERIVRVMGTEVQVKRYFFDVNMGDGKKGQKPIFVARLEQVADEWVWIGAEGESWWENPIDRMYAEQYEKEEINKKGLYANTRFYVNVLDRSLVLKDEDGKVLWEETYLTKDGEVKDEYKQYGEPSPNNLVMILEQSSGKVGVGANHFYQNLLDAGKTLKNRKGKPIPITACDLRIVGIKTDKTFAGFPVIKRQVYPGIDQDEVPDMPLYDIYSWAKPWPYAAIQAILDGEVYADVIKEYGIQMFPQKEGKETPEEDLPF